MQIRYREINEIEESDLLELINNKDSEAKILDYKRDLPGNDRKGRIEFLSDVSSFANTSGGHLIYGMDEQDGVPVKLTPISITDSDSKIQEMENRIRDGIQPRIPNVDIGEVHLTSGSVIVIRIGKSYNAPHRVTLEGHDKFYARYSRGKYPLNVHDLRNAFILSETVFDKVRNFRTQRIQMIKEKIAPVPVPKKPKIVLHLLPLDSFSLGYSTSIKNVVKNKELLQPMGSTGVHYFNNFEGYISRRPEPSDLENDFYLASGYCQYFRKGCIESLRVIRPVEPMTIEGAEIERWILESLPDYLNLLRKVGISPPIVIMVSMLDVQGYKIGTVMGSGFVLTSESSGTLPPLGIVQDTLLFPDVLLEDFDDNIATHLYSIFQVLWNSGGWSDSPSQR